MRFTQTSCEIYISKCEIYTRSLCVKKPNRNTCLKKSDFSTIFFEMFSFPATPRNSIFPHFVMVISDYVLWAPSCGLWLCVGALKIEGVPKIFGKLLDVGIIAVEISRTGPTTTVIFFLYLDICGPYAASSMVWYGFEKPYVALLKSAKREYIYLPMRSAP